MMSMRTSKIHRSSLWKTENFLVVQSILFASFTIGMSAHVIRLQWALPIVGLFLCTLWTISYLRKWGPRRLISALPFSLSFTAIWFLSLPINYLVILQAVVERLRSVG